MLLQLIHPIFFSHSFFADQIDLHRLMISPLLLRRTFLPDPPQINVRVVLSLMVLVQPALNFLASIRRVLWFTYVPVLKI